MNATMIEQSAELSKWLVKVNSRCAGRQRTDGPQKNKQDRPA